MSKAIGDIEAIRGETIVFGLRADPAYDGSEVVTCQVKPASDQLFVPEEATQPVVTITPVFSASTADQRAFWAFTISAAQSEGLEPGSYIADARVAYADGTVDYPKPIRIILSARVTGA